MENPATEHIEWRAVESSNVLKVGWDNRSNMYVLFRNREMGPNHQNTVYMYRGVPRQRAVAMARAKSVGQYLNRKIKPSFDAVRIV